MVVFVVGGFFFFFRVVGGGYEKQVFSGWRPGQSQPTRLRDPGRSHLPLPTSAPPCCSVRVPTPTSTLLATLWASYPGGQPSWHLGVPGRPRRAKGEDVGGAGRAEGWGRWGAELSTGPALPRNSTPVWPEQGVEGGARVAQPGARTSVHSQMASSSAQDWISQGAKILGPAPTDSHFFPSESQYFFF